MSKEITVPKTHEELIEAVGGDEKWHDIVGKVCTMAGLDGNTLTVHYHQEDQISPDVFAQVLKDLQSEKDFMAQTHDVNYGLDHGYNLVEQRIREAVTDLVMQDFDLFDDAEHNFLYHLDKYLKDIDIDSSEIGGGEIMDYLRDNNILYYDENVDELLDHSKIRLNLTLATPVEIDIAGSIVEMNTRIEEALSGETPIDDPHSYDFKILADNAFTWLVHDQDHTLSEFVNPDAVLNSAFLSSAQNELDNSPYSPSTLRVMFCVNWQELAAIAERDNQTISIPKEARIGLYEHVNGSGGPFGIELEKPLVIPKELISRITLDDASKEYHLGWPLKATYSFAPDDWKSGVEISNKSTLSISESRDMIDIEKLAKDIETIRGKNADIDIPM